MTHYVSTLKISASSLHSHFSNIQSFHTTDIDYCRMTNLCLVISDSTSHQAFSLQVHQAVLLPLCPQLGSLVVKDHSHHHPTLIFPDTTLSVLQGLLTLVYTGCCVLTNACSHNDLQSLMLSLGMNISNLTQNNEPLFKLEISSPQGQHPISPEQDKTLSGIRQVYPPNSFRMFTRSNKPIPNFTQLRPKSILSSEEENLVLSCSNHIDEKEDNNNQVCRDKSSLSVLTQSKLLSGTDKADKENKSSVGSNPRYSVNHNLRPLKSCQGKSGSSMSVYVQDPENKCLECGTMCLSPVHLAYHTAVNHRVRDNPSVVKCMFCHFSANQERKTRLLDHILTSHAQYLCSLCNVTLIGSRNGISPNLFVRHNKDEHNGQAVVTVSLVPPVKQKHACTECSLSYSSLAQLYYHIASQHVDPRSLVYQCRFCTYSRRKDVPAFPLQEHLLVHTGEKRNVCTFCGKKFTAKKTLVNHERLHTGEKRHKCDMCEAKFVQLTALKSHKKAHHPEKYLV